MVAELLNCELPEQWQARASHFYMEYTDEELQSGYPEVLKIIARHMRVAVERGRPELNKLPKERDKKKKMKAHEKEVMCHDPPPDCHHVERHSRSPRFVHCPLLCSDGFGSK